MEVIRVTFKNFPTYMAEDEFIQFWKEYFEEHQMKEKEDVNIYVAVKITRQQMT